MNAHLLVAGGASFFTVGWAIVLPGSLLPAFVDRLKLAWGDAGTLLAAQPLGHLLSVLTVARFASTIPAPTCAAAGFVPLALSLAILGNTTSFLTACAAMLASGAGIGLIESGANRELLREPGRGATQALNLTHLFFGLACIAAPPLASLAVDRGMALYVPFAVAGGVSLLAASTWLTYRRHPELDHHTRDSSRSLPYGFFLLALAMALYVGAEVGLGSWFTQYATAVLGMPLSHAGAGMALYWGGLTAGRLGLGLAQVGASVQLLTGLAVAAAVASAALLSVRDPLLYATLAALTGAALSGIFPGVLALAGRDSAGDAATPVSLLLAAACLGNIAFPWIMGVVADFIGLSAAMWTYPALCAALGCTTIAYGKCSGKWRGQTI